MHKRIQMKLKTNYSFKQTVPYIASTDALYCVYTYVAKSVFLKEDMPRKKTVVQREREIG